MTERNISKGLLWMGLDAAAALARFNARFRCSPVFIGYNVDDTVKPVQDVAMCAEPGIMSGYLWLELPDGVGFPHDVGT